MSTTAPPTINYQAMCDRVNALRESGHSKAAADAGGVEDPRDKGTASIPSHPDGDNAAKTRIPESSRPTNNVGVVDGVTQHVTNPGGTGENQPPAPADQNSKDDAFTSPTTPIEKIARAASNLKALRDGSQVKSAAATAPAPTTPKAGTPPKAKQADVEKTAADIQLSDDAHIKLASEILADESGRQWAFEFLNERHGEKVARAMIQDAAVLQQEMEKAAAEDAYMAKQAAAIQDQNVAYVNEMLKHASAAEREIFMKCAAAHHEAISANYARDIEAQYLYKAGAADAGMAQAMMAEGGDPGMPVLPGAGEGVEDGQIEQVIAAMVQSGELTPEEATAIMAALAGEGGGAPPVEGGGAPPEEGGGAPPEEMPKSAAAITQEIFDKNMAERRR